LHYNKIDEYNIIKVQWTQGYIDKKVEPLFERSVALPFEHDQSRMEGKTSYLLQEGSTDRNLR